MPQKKYGGRTLLTRRRTDVNVKSAKRGSRLVNLNHTRVCLVIKSRNNDQSVGELQQYHNGLILIRFRNFSLLSLQEDQPLNQRQ